MGMFTLASGLLVAVLFLHGSVKAEKCAGCPLEIDPKEDGGDKWVTTTLSSLSTNSPNPFHFVKIVRATRQLVSGLKYTYEVEVQEEGTNKVKRCTLVFLTKPWQSTKPDLISEDCTSKRVTREARQLLGGLKDVDESEMPTVWELANYAVSTLDDIDTDEFKQVIDDIIDAKKQLVNGIMYHLKLRVSTTSCKEGHTPDSDCLGQKTGESKLCKIQVHRSFADKSPLNAKVVKSECEPIYMPGGIHPIDVNDDSLNNIVDLAVQHISDMTNSMYVSGLVEIIRASSQVVQGVKYYLTVHVGDTQCLKNNHKNGDDCSVTEKDSPYKTLCDVVVWDKPWEKFTKVLSADCKSVAHKSGSLSLKRSVGTKTGAPVEIDSSDSYVQELSKFALSEMDKQTNSDYRLGIHNIIKATSQVVAGVKVTLEMAVGETECRKGEPTNGDCKPSKPTKVCKVTIWDRPWLKDRRILGASCQEHSLHKRGLVGGIREIDVNSNEVQELLPYTTQRVNMKINSIYVQGIVKVLKASTQVVEGTMTRMTVEVADTDCLKSENKPISDCHAQTNGITQICDVAVWDRPWLNKKEITQLSCHPKENLKRSAKHMPGAPVEINSDDSYVNELSKFALSEMDKETNSDYRLGVHNIIKATSQVVAGVRVTLEMAVGETKCKKGESTNDDCKPSKPTKVCTVTIWDRQWLKDRRILSAKCQEHSLQKRGIGGIRNIDVNSQQVKKLLPQTIEEVNNKVNSAHVQGIVRVLKASTQVVEGTMTRMTVEVADTDCLKTENRPISDCKVQSNGFTQICEVEIWSRPWLKKEEVTRMSCHPNNVGL